MTELQTVEIKQSAEIVAEGDDLESLLFHFLDELLFLFSCEPFLICSKVKITEFKTGDEYRIKCKCYGEEFQLGKHPQGTEVKAITYSAMQIIEEPEQNKAQVFVIIDIWYQLFYYKICAYKCIVCRLCVLIKYLFFKTYNK